jgi:hypothetical protein
MPRHQQVLRGVGQRLADAVDAAVIRRNQSVSIGKPRRGRQTRRTRDRGQASGDHCAARQETAHVLAALATMIV